MTISLNGTLAEQTAMVMGAAPGGSWNPAYWVGMGEYKRCTIIAEFTSTGAVTGGVVTLNQASAYAGTGAKALGFTTMLANTDWVTSPTMVQTAVVSNTFTVSGTTGKQVRYVIEIDSSQLDIANGFCYVKFVSTALVNATGNVTYIMWGARYSGYNPLQ